MGVIYNLEEVSSGRVPEVCDLINARDYYYNALTDPGAPTYDNIRLLILGSVATSKRINNEIVGPVTRRSDFDRLLIIGSLYDQENNKSLEKAGQQKLYIESVERATANKYHVKIEGKIFTEKDVLSFGPKIGDPLWISHCVDMQNNSRWSYRQPFDDFYTKSLQFIPGLRNYGLDITDKDKLVNPEVRSLLISNIMSYFINKENLFANAGIPDFRRRIDLHSMQRALEFGKASTRKALGISALRDNFVNGYDVTDKKSMREQSEIILDQIYDDGNRRKSNQMRKALDLVNGLDKDYEELLPDTLKTGKMSDYKNWLEENYLPACMAALFLSRSYYEWANDLTWTDETIMCNLLDEPNDNMEDSAGESIDLKEEETLPILVNMDQNEMYQLIEHNAMRRSLTLA